MQKQISDLLSTKGIWKIPTIEHHHVLSSTSDRVRKILETAISVDLPCLVVADEQTAGRGRAGKVWWSSKEALLFSLGLELSNFLLTRKDLPLLSLATGLSVLQAIQKYLPTKNQVALHWPNDVYVDSKKICGILIESPKPNLAVLGIGINVNNHLADIPNEFYPEFERRPIISMIEILDKKTDILLLLVDFLQKFQYNVEKGLSSDKLIREAEAYCIQVGRNVSISQNGREIQGLCIGIAPDASLLIQTESGIETVHSGIVQ